MFIVCGFYGTPTALADEYSETPAPISNKYSDTGVSEYPDNCEGIGYLPEYTKENLTDAEKRGRCTWYLWTGGNDKYYRDLAKRTHGGADLLKLIDSKEHDKRFELYGAMAVYYASKAYVLSFSEAIANELEGTGVSVTALCPGPTESGFQQRAAMEDSKLVSGQKIMTAEAVAEIGYRGLFENKTVVVPGIKNKLLAESVRFTPRKLVTKLVRNMQESK
ncbi:SDR family NAD(P)-dependent oxidoreductase [Nostoc sp.]|uniref:SDR family NAD(P)-dependent oxidoreductase n=1 Tax=Nostoc sp. TaxID=1180 RepID=UPI002FF61DCD